MLVADHDKRRLSEEDTFRDVLTGCTFILGVFALAFLASTTDRARNSPGSLDAGWFEAWGTWAGGLATAAAFLIAAASIAVTGAHARADRHDAAIVRESEDMAQARLLMIYRVLTPTVPRSMVTFRIENRSKDVFFDVSVPFVDRQNDSNPDLGRTTPAHAANSMQYLPSQELLTPYRVEDEHDGWFTQVVVYTGDPESVQFTVQYTDAAGRSWRQHLGGPIERVKSSNATRVREADRFQPHSQVRVMTATEAREAGLGEDIDWSQLDETTGFAAASWRSIRRVGRPLVRPVARRSGRICADIAWAPRGERPWRTLFDQRLKHDFPSNQSGSQGATEWVTVECDEDDLERLVGAVDAAIEHANNRFEQDIIDPLRALQDAATTKAKEIAKHQAGLDERAARLERPGHTPWRSRIVSPSDDDRAAD